jgi:hypothetical protein
MGCLTMKAVDEDESKTGAKWQPIAFSSMGMVVEADTSNAGSAVDIVSCLASGIGNKNALINAFTVQYSNDEVWFRYLDSNRMTVGYSRGFTRVKSQEAGSELVWIDDSKGLGQSGYGENHVILRCRLTANGSIEITAHNSYVLRRFFGLLKTRGALDGVYRFEKAYGIP